MRKSEALAEGPCKAWLKDYADGLWYRGKPFRLALNGFPETFAPSPEEDGSVYLQLRIPGSMLGVLRDETGYRYWLVVSAFADADWEAEAAHTAHLCDYEWMEDVGRQLRWFGRAPVSIRWPQRKDGSLGPARVESNFGVQTMENLWAIAGDPEGPAAPLADALQPSLKGGSWRITRPNHLQFFVHL